MPAKDEAARIGEALHAVARSIRVHGDVAGVFVAVIDDGSTDDTAAVASATLRRTGVRGAVIGVAGGSAGAARRLGAAAVLARVPLASDAWLLSTDADSLVPADWICRYAVHARAAHLAVAGVVDLIEDEDAAAVQPRWSSDYRSTFEGMDHPHAHACNLGLRVDLYRRVGGFKSLPRAEDIDLWRRVRALGVPTSADADLRVWTSARTDARCAGGFGAALRRYRA